MKKEAPSKSKFMVLKQRLGLALWQTIGLLETLWYITIINAPAGDIGRLSNEEIAAAMDWEGDPDQLIDTLVSTKWIDNSEEFRLVIHDWSDHAPTYLAGAFSKHGKRFANEPAKQGASDGAKQGAKQSKEQSAKQGASDGALARPSLSLAQSSPTSKANHTRSALGDRDRPASAKDLGDVGYEFARKAGYTGSDGRIFHRLASLIGHGLRDADLYDAAYACTLKQGLKQHEIPGFFRVCVRNNVAERTKEDPEPVDVEKLLESVP